MSDDEIAALLEQRLPQAFLKDWAKEKDPGVLRIFTDWLLEQGIEPEPVVEAFKELNAHRVLLMHMEEVLREQGNLETKPLRVQWLSYDEPSTRLVHVQVDDPNSGMQAVVAVELASPGRPARVDSHPGMVRFRTSSSETWHVWPDWETLRDHQGPVPPYPFAVDERQAVQRAVLQAEHDDAPWVGLEGELFYNTREPVEFGLWLDYPPEYLERQLERQVNRTDTRFRTLYTYGGGYQNELDIAFVDLKTNELWQRVHGGSYNPEVECPFKNWNDEEREDERDRVCTDHDTLYGEYPHEKCRFCEADLGEEHGYLYVGEGGEYVYALVPDEEEEEERDPYRDEPRFPQGTTFVAAERPLTGEAYTIDLQSTHTPDDDGHYVNPRRWNEALEVDWDLADVREEDFGEEVGVVVIDGRELHVWTWEI